MIRLIPLFLLLSLSVWGCSKYHVKDDLEGTWILSKYITHDENEVDSTTSKTLEIGAVSKRAGTMTVYTHDSAGVSELTGTFTLDKGYSRLNATLTSGTYYTHWDLQVTVNDKLISFFGNGTDNLGFEETVFIDGFK